MCYSIGGHKQFDFQIGGRKQFFCRFGGRNQFASKIHVLRSTQRTNGRSSRRCLMGEMGNSFQPQHQAVEDDANDTRQSHCLGEWINQTIFVLVHSSTLIIVSTDRWQQEDEDRSSILSPTPIHRRLWSTTGYLLTQPDINKDIIIAR